MPLQVFVDGALLPEADGRALWARFSEHMETNRGDLAGFASAEGFASIHPEMRDGAPALIVSKSGGKQRAYANAPVTNSKGPGPKGPSGPRDGGGGGGGGNRPGTGRSGSSKPQVSSSRGPSPQNSGRSGPKR